MPNDAGTTPSMTSVEPTRLVNTDQLKREIQEKLPISQVAVDLCDVELIKSGHQYKGLCPLHGEDTPSFYVNDSKNVYHCFGCKQSGDAISLVREIHHVGYREALIKLADAAGVDISQYERPATDEEKQRDEFRIGGEEWLAGLNPDTSRCEDPVVLGAYGVVVAAGKPEGSPPYFDDKDYLFEGVIFPYRTPAGALTGWKVRKPDKVMFGTPKGFPLYEPTLFGIDVARPHIERVLIVVEGEYDVLALAEHGIWNVVAIGSGITIEDQLQVLKDLNVREVVFYLDGDKGGYSAAESIAKKTWEDPELRVRIALCPANSDPEDIVRAVGPQMVLDQVEKARGSLEWLLWEKYEADTPTSLGQKLDYVAWIQGEYGTKLSGVQEALVLHEVAKWLEIPEADILDFTRSEKTLLQAVDSEKVVLGKAIREAGYFLQIRKRIAKDDFFVLKHQRTWEALSDMLVEGLQFDATVSKRMAEGRGVDPEYVELLAATGDLNIGWHEDRVIDYSVRRAAQQDADRFREVIADINVPANQLIGVLTHSVTSKALGRGSGAFEAISDQVDEAVEKMHDRMANPDDVIGISLGSQFPLLTRNLQGIQSRRLVTLMATSGKGKSTLAIQWLTNMAVHQAIPCDLISVEMDADEILFKQCSHLTGIDSLKISGGRLSPAEAIRVEQAMLRIRKSPMRIYAPDGITPSEFVLYAREAVMDRRSEVFVLDFIQQMGPDPDYRKQSRYEQLGHAAYTMKQKICRGLDVAVICCAQLKRDAAGKEEPTPEDVGDSYEIVRASDVVVILNEPEEGRNEIWIGKNRQGPGQQVVPTNYDKPCQTMRELSGAKEPDYRVI